MEIDKFVSKLSDKGYAEDSAGQQFRIAKDKQRGNRSWRYKVNSKAGEVVSGASPSRDLAIVNALSEAVLQVVSTGGPSGPPLKPIFKEEKMKWFYESDGGNGSPKTHYLISEDFSHRIDCKSRTVAVTLAKAMNSGLVCSCTDTAYLNWNVLPSGATWVIYCKKCGSGATYRAEIEHGMTDKHDCMGSVKSWLELMKHEHEERIK